MKHDEVLNPFLALMRAELIANVQKGDRPGWLAMSADQCMAEIHYHVGKLHWAMRHSSERGMAEVVEFSADVANLCMMLLDICGALAYAPQPPAGGEPEVLAWRGVNELNEVVTEWIDGQPPEAMADLCGNPASFHRLETLIDRAHFTALQARLQAAEARNAELEQALKFYADKEHYHFESDNWDSVSGEAENLLWHSEDPDFIENGTIAKRALAQQVKP